LSVRTNPKLFALCNARLGASPSQASAIPIARERSIRGRRALVVDRQQAADALADLKMERGSVQVRASIAESEGCHSATRPN
jgi:hypothetical protein